MDRFLRLQVAPGAATATVDAWADVAASGPAADADAG